MNYYDHHIRDYDAATAHLSWDEDLAYTRLIRWYYRKEQPIPADIKEACRQVRATTKTQRDAVAAVLKEFFDLRIDGWHKDTCDEAIKKYIEGEPEREIKKANEDNRTKRHREERAKLFKALTDAGGHASWNIGITDLRAMVAALPVTAPETKPVTPVTAPVTPVTATHTPIPNTHTPDLKTNTNTASETLQVGGAGNSAGAASSAGEISKAMREHGVMSNPSDPRILELVAQGVNVETVRAACQDAKAAKPNERIGPGYVFAILTRWANEAKEMSVNGARPPSANKQDSRAAAAASIGLGAKPNVEYLVNPDE